MKTTELNKKPEEDKKKEIETTEPKKDLVKEVETIKEKEPEKKLSQDDPNNHLNELD